MLKEILIKQLIAFLFIIICTYCFRHSLKKQWRLMVFLPFFVFSIFVKPITIQIKSNFVLPSIADESVQINWSNNNLESNLLSWNNVLFHLWILGIAFFVIIYFMNYLHFYYENDWELLENGKISIYVSENSQSVFSTGIIKKKIVVPPKFLELSEKEQQLILKHEKTHFQCHHQEM